LKVLHLVIGLGQGGAERNLFRLCTTSSNFTHEVWSLTSQGHFGPLLKDSGIVVRAFGMTYWNLIVKIPKVLKTARESAPPDIIHGWMPHGALVATLVSKVTGAKRLFWGIRASSYGSPLSAAPTWMIVKVLAKLSSRYPRKILCVGTNTLEAHSRLGFATDRMEVVENGFPEPKQTEVYDFAPHLSEALPHGTRVFGMVARFHPQKAHELLLRALAELPHDNSNFLLVLVGPGLTEDNRKLVDLITSLGLARRVVMLGSRVELDPIYRGFDFHVLPSAYGEGFPNVVAESMLNEVPNIVSDVGDSARVVGDAGWVVPRNSAPDLTNALLAALKMKSDDLAALGSAARLQILKNFDLGTAVSKIESFYGVRQVAAYPKYSKTGASSRVRMYQYSEELAFGGWEASFYPLVEKELMEPSQTRLAWSWQIFRAYVRRIRQLRFGRWADLVWVEKELFPYLPAWVEIMLFPKTPSVIDFDDAQYLRYRDHPVSIVSRLLSQKIERVATVANLVVAGNSTLARYFEATGTKAVVTVPSAVKGLATGEITDLPGEKTGAETFKIGWIGTPASFQSYLEPLLARFIKIAEDLEGQLAIMGSGLPPIVSRNLVMEDWSLEAEKHFLLSLNVGIMPLTDDEWARGKCGFKILQYMAFSKPVVASPIGVNLEIVSHGVNGYLVAKDEDWTTHLTIFKNSPAQSLEMGFRGKTGWEEKYSVSVTAPKILRSFDTVQKSRGQTIPTSRLT